MKKIVSWFSNPPVDGNASIIIIRLMAGIIFFFEGVLKFVYPNQGVGRFTKLGFPWPGTTAHFVATAEIIGGSLLILGLLTRYVAIYFIAQMIVAVLSTKIGLFLGSSPLPMPPSLPKTGIWAVEHETRADYAQILCCLYLLIEGAGRLSLDAMMKMKIARFKMKNERPAWLVNS